MQQQINLKLPIPPPHSPTHSLTVKRALAGRPSTVIRGSSLRPLVPECRFSTASCNYLVARRAALGKNHRDGRWFCGLCCCCCIKYKPKHMILCDSVLRSGMDAQWFATNRVLCASHKYHFNGSDARFHIFQTSSDGNQTTSTLSISLNRSDAGRYLACRAYNHAVPSDALEDGWRLDIQCKLYIYINMVILASCFWFCWNVKWIALFCVVTIYYRTNSKLFPISYTAAQQQRPNIASHFSYANIFNTTHAHNKTFLLLAGPWTVASLFLLLRRLLLLLQRCAQPTFFATIALHRRSRDACSPWHIIRARRHPRRHRRLFRLPRFSPSDGLQSGVAT